MRRIGWFSAGTGFCILLGANISLQAQNSAFEVPTTNTHAVIHQKVAATDIEISYNRPCVKGRTIFGTLVPFGKVWRTGSDAATSISFSTPVTVEGKPISAGTYEVFSVPGDKEWTVILHENRSQWGSYAYDATHDVARFIVKPVSLHDRVETFTISIDDITTNAATLNISWDKIRVPVRFTIDVQKTVVPQLEEALKKDGRRPYFRAAMFYFENNLDINRAAELMKLAVEENPNHIGMLYRLALILERKGDMKGAREAAQRSLAGAATASTELREEYTKLNTQLLKRLNN